MAKIQDLESWIVVGAEVECRPPAEKRNARYSIPQEL
jgi:hypothetical protein